MEARQKGHDKSNAERKLTDEQRREKIEKIKEKDESKGIHAAVFKVRYLSDGGHKFKVRKNADQNNLSGVLIFNPKFNMVYVEGGNKGIRAYTRLMTERVKWKEASAARGVTSASTPTLDGDPAEKEASVEPAAAQSAFGTEEPHNLADNYCYLVWEGEIKERAYRGFRPKACPSDALAKEFLGNQAGFWDIARKYSPEDEV
jgi:U4/U6 small nuclear ribonucleoprotein PRP3